jgi:hypothetical protein
MRGGGIALIFARTETRYFQRYAFNAHAILFLDKRVSFLHVDGRRAERNAGAPSVLIAYSERDAETLRTCGLSGRFVPLKGVRLPPAWRLVTAAESALRVLREICDPTLTHMPEDERVRDELRAALALFRGLKRERMVCRECGNAIFDLLLTATDIQFFDGGSFTFKCLDEQTNREGGFVCTECGDSAQDFDGTWEFTASPI